MPLLWLAVFFPCLALSLPSHTAGGHNSTVGGQHQGETSSSKASGHITGHDSASGGSHLHHGEANGHNHAEELGPQARVAAVMLMGSMCYGMALLYLTNAPNRYVRFTTWKMLAATLSIFIAVLWYQAFDELMENEIEHRPDDINDVKSELQIFTFFVIPLIHFLVWYILLQLYCFCTAARSEVIRTAGVSVGSHICAFAFIQPFGSLMDLHPFNLNLATAMAAVFLSMMALWIVFMLSDIARLRWLWPHLSEEIVSVRDKAVTEAENDMAAISLGLLISQVLRFAIHGQLPDIDPVPVYHEQWEASVLLACAVAFVGCTVVLSRLRILAERNESRWQRMAEALQKLSVMTMAWSILFWGHWEVYDVQFRDEPLLGRIVLAVCLSVVAFVLIFSLKGLMSLGRKDVTETLLTILEGIALMTAFSWELAFDRAADALADDVPVLDRHTFKFIMCVLIVLLCLPGYVLFFLPMSLQAPDEQQLTRTWSGSLKPACRQTEDSSTPMASSEDSQLDVQKSLAASNLQSLAPTKLQANVKTETLVSAALTPLAIPTPTRGEHRRFPFLDPSCLCQFLGAFMTPNLANSPHCPPLKQTAIGKHGAETFDDTVILCA